MRRSGLANVRSKCFRTFKDIRTKVEFRANQLTKEFYVLLNFLLKISNALSIPAFFVRSALVLVFNFF
jgi:hypothetical protein